MEEYKYLLKDEFIKDKLEKILQKVEENEFKIAYKTSQLLINYINLDYIKKKYNIIKVDDSQMLNIMNIYLTKDKELFYSNKYINDLYVDISEREPEREDILELLIDADELCRKMEEKK